ncbi:MAG: hypothetical protein ACRCYU_08710 [Nocardioides sp.]
MKYHVERWGPPPRLLVATSVLMLVVCTALAIDGAFRSGITTDEPIHVMRLRNYFETGWYALDWDYGGAGPGGPTTNVYVYAPVTTLLLHAWSVLWGVESWGEVATSSRAYDIRHLGVAVVGLIGVGAVGVIGRVILRHWRWGLVSAASLAAIPMWTGHQMFNVKDVPVATGYTLVTLGLLLFVRPEHPGVRFRLARSACLVAGLILALGTRPGMWSSIGVTGLITVLGVLLVARTGSPSGVRNWRTATIALAELAACCAVAATILVAAYPRVFGTPVQALTRSTESSSSFLNGLKSDRLYVPRHVAQEMPTLLLLFVLVGIVIAAIIVRHRWRSDPVTAVGIMLVGTQALALPIVSIIVGSDLYHGLRQLLFAAPASAVLATYGMAWCLTRATAEDSTIQGESRIRGGRAPGRWLLPMTVAALLMPVADQVSLHPYQTTYANLATDLVTGPFDDPTDRPGGDFWRVSLPELIASQPLDRQLICKAIVTGANVSYPFTNAGEAFSTSRSVDCRQEVNGPLFPQRLPVEPSGAIYEYDSVFLEKLPTNCEPLNEVTRRRHGFTIAVTTLGRCTISPPVLTQTGVQADHPALGKAGTKDLWRFAIDGWQQWPGRRELAAPVSRAVLAFNPTPLCVRQGCTFVIDGSGPPDLIARIGNDEVPVQVGPTQVGTVRTLRIPISAAQARAGEAARGVWLTFTRQSGAVLDMRMTGLSLSGRAPEIERSTEPGKG